jgi:chitodextrinase
MPSPRRLLVLSVSSVLIALVLPFSVLAAGPVTLEGRLVLAHGDEFDVAPHDHAPGTPADHSHGGRSILDYSLVTADGQSHKLAFANGQGPDDFVNGATVRVRGTDSGGAFAVDDDGSAQVLADPVAPAVTTKKLAVILVNFQSNKAEPWTVDAAKGIVFTNNNSIAAYFDEESDGQLALTGDVLGWYTIDYDTSTCNYSEISSKARAAATAAGVNLSTYTNIQYAFPSLPCGWAGLAYLPGTESWVNNALNLRVSAHELSHNFGVHHASTLSCSEGGTRVSLSTNLANCSQSEYGDPFSIMGSASTRHTHNQQLASLGWLPTSQRLSVTTGGTYSLGAAEDQTAAVRAIRVARGNGTYLYLELRRPTGLYFDNFSSTDPAVKGVSIRLSNDWGSIIQSKLIDATPATTSFGDASLLPGFTFTDPLSGVNITTVSVDTTGATVDIDWGEDASPPTTPSGLSASLTSATTSRLTWGASSDNRGVTGYRVSRGATVLGTVTTTSFNDSGLVPGTYGYSVVALDGAGNESAPATTSLVVPEPDVTPPSAPSNLRISSQSKSRVTLAWDAASDNVAVTGYRVYRNGVLVATVTALTWTDSIQSTQSTYTVIAVDAAGNTSSSSNSVTVAGKGSGGGGGGGKGKPTR